MGIDKVPLCQSEENDDDDQLIEVTSHVPGLNYSHGEECISVSPSLCHDEDVKSAICEVCKNEITYTMKNALVVKCDKCNECTVVGIPPAGIKYMRCSCNCLVRVNSDQIYLVLCPRKDCNQTVSDVPGLRYIMCGHCQRHCVLNINSTKVSLIKCVYCLKTSSFNPKLTCWKIYRCIFVSLFCLLSLVITISFRADFPGVHALIWSSSFFMTLGIAIAVRLYIYSRVHSKIYPCGNKSDV